MKSILNLFKKCKRDKEEINESENDNIDKTRTLTEINKLLYKLDDELQNLNISVEETLKLLKIIREKYSGFNLGINIIIEKCIDIFILNPNNADIVIKKLNECNCCEHHKKNKPKKLVDVEWKKNVPLYKVSEKMELLIFNFEDNETCNCFCRHYSRIIQSTFNV